ncbi:MAG: gluconate 5-dehydrogenase [Betaproteobacteria bacterium SG8_40]|jgi:gluconate 5-dehydrogenase|nr:MAG: gluconate 5-dehydrogenase [Betaproteobacteria bacterium SG8_40]
MSIKKLFDLSGKTALITGGSRGLGLQMAEALGEMGAKVAITARKAAELEEASAHLSSLGIESLTVVNDLQQTDTVKPMVENVLKAFGQIDILVNNAGAAWGSPAEDHPLDAWHKVINLNLTAPFLVSQTVGKLSMIPRKYGKIINIASIAGLVGTEPGFMPTIAYNSSKGGVVNFTRSLGAEWATHNITVNAIAPGVFPSKMSKGMIDRAEQYIMDQTPMKRLGGDEDLKGVTVLLASDASAYMTGQIIAVDGGYCSV